MSDFEMLMVVLPLISLVLISNQNQKNNHSQLLTE
ncbi:hypothetical protein MUA19_01810 [Staphylococcus chromogenes]|nr:hypothetical protein [Staphylococcus chromogenes]MEB7825627.1 hypothetical protein [Staphylococcus chromogenes]UXS68191.1 hypothetical protein MUA19_01810 [Staphylococcus chromogenes]